MKTYEKVIDVAETPTLVLGRRASTWWGTTAFIAIEFSTLVICVMTYLYLRKNEHHWPPPPLRVPDIIRPTITAVFLALTVIPNYWLHQRVRRLDKRGVQFGLLVMSILVAIALVLRLYDFRDINAHWDTNAYGSAVWITIAFHSTLLFLEALETWVFTALFWFGPIEGKHFSDADDNCVYWYFMSLVWIPMYMLLYWVPRLR
jgi:heme/copper-type cytochrome/quinol oxidase subunit 3